MAKCITIESCKDCPHLTHSGGFGHPRYKPLCGKSKNRLLPYETVIGLESAQYTGIIPIWCQLDDLQNKDN